MSKKVCIHTMYMYYGMWKVNSCFKTLQKITTGAIICNIISRLRGNAVQ